MCSTTAAQKGHLQLQHLRWTSKKTDDPGRQFFRYLLAGAAGFVLDISLLFLLTELVGLHYLISAPLAFIAGMLLHYLLCITWIFYWRRLSNKWLEFSIYAGLGALGLILNEAVIWLFAHVLSFHYLLGKMFYLLIFLLLFLVRKKLLFSAN
ncbi:MAG: GtrA family protein [Desulfohalobiaceae bacterium]